jgi:CHAT domain-containing protein
MDEGHTESNSGVAGYDWETTNRLVSRIASTDRDVDAVPIIRDLLASHGEALWYELRDMGTRQRGLALSVHRAGVDALFDILCHYYPDSGVGAQAILDVLLWRRRLASAFEATGLGLSRVDAVRASRVSNFYSYRRQYADWVWSSPDLRALPNRRPGEYGLEVLPDSIYDRPEYDELWSSAFGDLEFVDYAGIFPEVRALDVAERLPEGRALVEYWRAENLRDTSGQLSPRYFAVAVSGHDPVRAAVIDLCSAKDADDAIEQFLGSLDDKQWLHDAALTVRQLVFDRLPDFVRDATRIYIVPDGRIALVPFAVLPEENGYLIDRLRISHLQSGQDLARTRRLSSSSSSPVVIAAPTYSLGKQTESVLWPPLAGAAAEGAEVAELLGVKEVVDVAATAEVLLGVRSPHVLHIATHGDYLDARPYSASIDPLYPVAETQSVWLFADHLRRLAGRPISYPELRSVLALAGANDWLSGADLDDKFGRGHVTGEDLANLDLDGTELVVLSACSSGAGETSLEHGMVGLRSALSVAGARTLIMSLWKIDDEVTRELMAHFYAGLNRGLLRSDALRDAQLSVRQHHNNPRDWGAFIMEGEDGILNVTK